MVEKVCTLLIPFLSLLLTSMHDAEFYHWQYSARSGTIMISWLPTAALCSSLMLAATFTFGFVADNMSMVLCFHSTFQRNQFTPSSPKTDQKHVLTNVCLERASPPLTPPVLVSSANLAVEQIHTIHTFARAIPKKSTSSVDLCIKGLLLETKIEIRLTLKTRCSSLYINCSKFLMHGTCTVWTLV